MPVVTLIQQAQKTAQLPQPQFIDEVVDDSVLIRRQVLQSKLYRENQSRCLSLSSATEWWIPVVQLRTDATGAIPEQDCGRPGRDAEANRSPESSEEDRDSTRSALGKMVDGPVVRFTGLRHG